MALTSMLKPFLACLLLFITFSAYSQEPVLLKGKIIADSLEGSFINIVNLSQETGVINNEFGEFEIEVYESDTLYFSSVQYEAKEVYITPEIIAAGFLEVWLFLNVNQLEEVRISNIRLSGNLERDLANIKTFNQLDVGIPYPTKPRLSSVERKLFTASGSSLDLLLNLLNGKVKMLKRARENQQLAGLVDKGMNLLPLSIYVEELEIPEEHVKNFVYFCAEDPGFKSLVYQESPLELLEYYQSKVRFFLEERMGK